jgi:hypothetical protein
MAKKKTISQLHKLVWEECKRVFKPLLENYCYTCGAYLDNPFNKHLGHGKPKASLPVRFKYDKRNLRNQCMRCNIHLGGASDIFIAKLEKEKEGLAFLKEACRNVDGIWYVKKEEDLSFDSRLYLENLLSELKNVI